MAWSPCWKPISTVRASNVHGAISTNTWLASSLSTSALVGTTGTRLRRREERDVGEHVRLQPHVRIVEGDAHLGAARVGIEHVADEQHLALEHLARIGREDDVDRLSLWRRARCPFPARWR